MTNLFTTTTQNIKTLIPEKQAKSITENIVYFILGVFISKGIAFGIYAPFGTAFLAAVPYRNMPFSLIGTIIGYILPSEINIGIRYISTAVAVCAIRWTLNDLTRIKSHKLYAPLISFFTIVATSLAVNISNISDLNEVVMYTTEAILSGGAAYFFHESMDIFLQRRTKIKQTELLYVCMTVFMIILSLLFIKLGDVSIGKILANVVIIFCARYMGLFGGSVAGITAGVIFGLAYKEPSYIMGAYAFGGLVAGLASSFGRIACCLSFLVANIIVSVQTGNPSVIISGIYEILVASLIFIFLRDDFGDRFIGIFSSQNSYERHEGLKSTVAMRLNFISKALENISEAMDAVSEKLSKIGKNKSSNIYLSSINKTCNNCGLKAFCFETKSADTLSTFSQVDEILQNKGQIDKNDFPENFIQRCSRKGELANNINSLYREISEKRVSENRISEVREIVSEQFSEVSLLLSGIVEEIKNCGTFDIELAKKIETELRKLNLKPLDVCCLYDRFGRLYIEFEINEAGKNEIEKLNLSRKLSKICGRKLNLPCINAIKDLCKVNFTEKPILAAQIGAAQHICKNGILCGDNYTYFNDGLGRLIFILSDGMGTGGRAAVEGAMACRFMENLVKSGINFLTAAKITNSALLMKSEDEVLATLDVLSVDLFNGKVNLLKAGAPLTLLRKNGIIYRYAPSSLPIGILKEVKVAEYTDILTSDDRLLIVSDGAISNGDDWLEDSLKSWGDEDSQSFADSVIKRILGEKNADFDDDITVIAVKLTDCI